jgi:hypothetical protein
MLQSLPEPVCASHLTGLIFPEYSVRGSSCCVLHRHPAFLATDVFSRLRYRNGPVNEDVPAFLYGEF